MSMTSLEIRQHQFRKVLRGFESKEVSAFLSQLADEIETLQNENRELKTSLSEAVKELEHFHRLEQTIQQTLIQAQESSNKFLANAKQYETQSKREAEEQAENLIRDAHREVIRLKEEISILQAKQKNIVENLKQFLEKGLELVNKTESAIQSEMPESEMMEEKRKYDAEIDDIVKTLVG